MGNIQEQAKILTEEELEQFDMIPVDAFLDMNEVRNLVASHRLLLSANAELSWYKNAYKQTLKAIADSTTTQIEALRSMAKSTLRGDDNE